MSAVFNSGEVESVLLKGVRVIDHTKSIQTVAGVMGETMVIQVFSKAMPADMVKRMCEPGVSEGSWLERAQTPEDKRLFKMTSGLRCALKTFPEFAGITRDTKLPRWKIEMAFGNYLIRNREKLRFRANPRFFDLSNDPLGLHNPTKVFCECYVRDGLSALLIPTDEWVIIILFLI